MRSLRSNDNNNSTTTNSGGTTEANRASNGLTSGTEKRKRLIMRVQFALLDRGYYNGNIDGIMGPSTRQSIKIIALRTDYQHLQLKRWILNY